VEGPTGRGGRVDPHHGDRWGRGDTVWPDGDERRRQPIVVDGRSVGARKGRACDVIGCDGGRWCSWTHFIGRGGGGGGKLRCQGGETTMTVEVLLNSQRLPKMGRGIKGGGIEMRSTTGGEAEAITGTGGSGPWCMARWFQPAAAVLSPDEEDEGHIGLGWAITASWVETRMGRHG
jgi:hypothetical protein